MTRRSRNLITMNVAIVVAIVALTVAHSAHATPPPSCDPDMHKYVTVNGTIHFVRSTVRPMIGRDGKADYSIVDTIDEYEMSLPGKICGLKTLRVRFEYGDVRYVSCADNVKATVSGFLRRDDSDGGLFLSVVSPSGFICKSRD